MEILYGDGWYMEGNRRIAGKIILGKNKLFIRGEQGDLPQTFISTEHVVSLERKKDCLSIRIQLSLVNGYQAVIKWDAGTLRELTEELAKRAGLKKRFWSSVWRK